MTVLSCLSVCRPVCQSIWRCVWVHLRWRHISVRLLITLLVAQWMGMTGKHLYINLYFFHPSQSSNDGSCFKTWLPFLQSQWKGLSRVPSSLSASILSPFFSPLCPHSERFGRSEMIFFFLTDRTDDKTLLSSRNTVSWAGLMSSRWSYMLEKWHQFYSNKNFTSEQHTHKHTHIQSHAPPCIALHVCASKP